MKYPMAHKVIIPKPYIRSEATDVSKTIRLAQQALRKQEQAQPLRMAPANVLRLTK